MSAYGKDDPLSGKNISEANAKIPRKVRFDDNIVSALGFTLFFLMLWLVPASWVAYEVHICDILRREGYEINGEVTKSYTGRGGVDVEYRFTVDGIMYTGNAKMIADEYKVQTLGEIISIRYLPKDPRVNQPVKWEWYSARELIFYLSGLGLLVVAGALIIAGLRKRKLARMGVVVEGKVTGCTPNRKLFTVYYEFTTKDNVWMEGSTEMPEECEAGDSMPIIYLRGNPRRNDYYPM